MCAQEVMMLDARGVFRAHIYAHAAKWNLLIYL